MALGPLSKRCPFLRTPPPSRPYATGYITIMPASKTLVFSSLWTSLLLALPALGQRSSRSGIGLKVGAQMSVTWVEGLHYDPIPGAVAGAYIPLWCGARFELQPEVLGSMLGSSFTDSEGQRHVIHLYYVQLPLSAKFFFTNALNAQGGFQMGRLLSAQSSPDNSTATDLYRPFEFGTNIGLGLDLMTGLDLTFRYYNGLSSITDDVELNPTNRAWQFTVGYRIARFKKHRRVG